MRLTTKFRHAITALIHVANETHDGERVSLAEISRIQGVSLSYLEQLFSRLRKYDIVTGARGPGGGYKLNAAPETISIAKIMDAIEDHSHEERLRSFSSSRRDEHNFAQSMWNEFSHELYEYLNQVRLDRFIEKHNEEQTIEGSQT